LGALENVSKSQHGQTRLQGSDPGLQKIIQLAVIVETWLQLFQGWITYIHRINRYPEGKCRQNRPRYPLGSDLTGGCLYPPFEQPRPAVK